MSRELRNLAFSYGVQVSRAWNPSIRQSSRSHIANSFVSNREETVHLIEKKKKKNPYKGASGAFSRKNKWSDSKAARRQQRQPDVAEEAGGQADVAEEAGGQADVAEEAGGQAGVAEEAGGQAGVAEEAGGQAGVAEEAGGQADVAEEAGGQPDVAEEAGGQADVAEEGDEDMGTG